MNSKVCANCNNEKPVNLTSNRLVTEDCGHVKCMDCLLQEKNGCLACSRDIEEHDECEDSLESEPGLAAENGTALSKLPEFREKMKIELDFEGEEPSIINEKLEIPHIKTITDSNNIHCYLCTLCNKRFYPRSHVPYHAYCNGRRKPYQCPECKKTFSSGSHFKYHMAVHYDERTYRCDECGQCFFQMSKLKRHQLKHTNEKKYACTECEKSFDNQTALRKHRLTHTKERPFVCPACGNRFRDPSNYKKHMHKHEVNKCTCAECGQAAVSGRALAAHCRALHARRRHACPHCAHTFHSGKDMRRHAQVHTDSKPFRCKVCSRRFRRKDNLERHVRNTHPDFVPASAVECDNPPKHTNGHSKSTEPNKAYESNEKIKLLNPLPPLPEDVIQKHMHTDEKNKEPAIDKSFILAANNARESVICKGKGVERIPSPVEYVHKIRKANSMVSQKDMPLPPIDTNKLRDFLESEETMTVDPLLPKDLKIYKTILGYGQYSKDSGLKQDKADDTTPACEMHWRKKKLNINW